MGKMVIARRGANRQPSRKLYARTMKLPSFNLVLFLRVGLVSSNHIDGFESWLAFCLGLQWIGEPCGSPSACGAARMRACLEIRLSVFAPWERDVYS
jgi:hypothetical protein